MPEPYGVVGIILTWNGPVVSVGMKLIPALAAGNTVVMKPSELTPYATEHLMGLVKEAGIPDGVVNLVLGGPQTGDALVRHPLVQKVSFTGGPATARKILAACAESLKPAVLELGGKSANILFPDADLDTAVAVNAFSVLGTLAGQGCAIPSRMIVHTDIYDDVVERVLAIVAGMHCGDPFDPASVISPVVTREAQARILAMIERAQADGAKLLAGGRAPSHLPNGFFVEPTVLGDVDPSLRARSDRGVRTGVVAHAVSDRRGSDRDGELDRLRTGFLRLHQGHRPHTADGERAASRRGVRRTEPARSPAVSSRSAASAFPGSAARAARRSVRIPAHQGGGYRVSKPLNLNGAVAVLTGAGSGIGRATAVEFAERGASVVVSDLSEARVTEVVEQITALGRPALGLTVDVTIEADLEKLRDAALQRFGRIDLVMNNVGVLAIGAPKRCPTKRGLARSTSTCSVSPAATGCSFPG